MKSRMITETPNNRCNQTKTYDQLHFSANSVRLIAMTREDRVLYFKAIFIR